jgi:hypothetical protein
MAEQVTIEVTMPAKGSQRKYKVDVTVNKALFGKGCKEETMSSRLTDVLDKAWADVEADVLPPKRPLVGLAMFLLHNQEFIDDEVYAQYTGRGTSKRTERAAETQETASDDDAADDAADENAVETVWSTLTDPDFKADDDLDKIVEYLGDLDDQDLADVETALEIIRDWLKAGPARARASPEAKKNKWLFAAFVEGMKQAPAAAMKHIPASVDDLISAIQAAEDASDVSDVSDVSDASDGKDESDGDAW